MKIILAGAGKIGTALTRLLLMEGHDLTVIDIVRSKLDTLEETYDVFTVCGNCALMSVLEDAGIETADILVAATRNDEDNLMCCMAAKTINPKVHTIARIRDPEYNVQLHRMRDAFRLAMTFNPEKDAAREIARILEYPEYLERDSFIRDQVEIVELPVGASSPLCGAKLMDLPRITRCRVLVCVVVRGGEAFMPSGSFSLEEKDKIYVTAPSSELRSLLAGLGISPKRNTMIMLAGCGRLGFYVAEQLLRSGLHVRIVENNAARCEELADLLPGADIRHADATRQSTITREGLEDMDALVSMTSLDEMNILISLYAHDLGVRQVVTKLRRQQSIGIVDRLQLGAAVCPQDLCGNAIVRYIRALHEQTGAALSVHKIALGLAEAQEFMVDETTKFRNTPLRNIRLKENVIIGCISHFGNLTIPAGNDSFTDGDILIVVTARGTVVEQLNDIFA